MPPLPALWTRAGKAAVMLGAVAGMTLAPVPQTTAATLPMPATAAALPTTAASLPYLVSYNTGGGAPLIAGDPVPFPLATNDPAFEDQLAAPDTSPSTVATPGLGFETAFQGRNGDLWFTGTQFPTDDTGIQMAPGTSPSLALAPGTIQAAWQGTNGDLWITGPNGPVDLGLAMMPGTSPALTELPPGSSWEPNGGPAVVFQGSDGHPWYYQANGSGRMSSSLFMAPGTSPAIAYMPAVGGWQAVWQGANNHLWTTGAGPTDTGLAMMPGTNPSLTELGSGGYEAAVQGANGDLWTSGALTNGDTGRQMVADTSPSIAATFFATPGAAPTDDYYVAYGAANSSVFGGQMELDDSNTITKLTNGADVIQGQVASGTSPSIAILGM